MVHFPILSPSEGCVVLEPSRLTFLQGCTLAITNILYSVDDVFVA